MFNDSVWSARDPGPGSVADIGESPIDNGFLTSASILGCRVSAPRTVPSARRESAASVGYLASFGNKAIGWSGVK
jgi:hypothetical protein